MSNNGAVNQPAYDQGSQAVASTQRRTWFLFAPIVAFVLLSLVLAFGLTRNARDLPSALIGKPVPEFSLPPVKGRTLGLSSADLKGEVSLVNVFASWCVACRYEHPFFMELTRSGAVPLHGLNYKDRPDDAAGWLDRMGDPYVRTGADLDGRVAIEWGVYGVPETFVVDGDGRIAYRHIGPVARDILDRTILPLVERLRRRPRGDRKPSSQADRAR
ncbi:MAG: DsbE family thiol:disulfide interchange protein [Hyphomicrobiaceae bacterium]|nr:MAG: DsbE family thiol:disulfide interchange protein [Hyphomicrobiaceae bacterium]